MVLDRSANCMNSSSSSLRLRVVALSSPYMRPTNSRYSGAFKRSNKPIPSGTTPICRLTSTGCWMKSRPRSDIRPEVGASSPVNILMVVDLPAPFGPRKPKNWPDSTCRSMPSTAVSAPKRRVSFSVEIAISTEKLTRRFGALTAVDGMDLQVESGQFFGFLGPNGAGKSTTIKMLTGLLAPTSGRMSLLGLDFSQHPIEVKRQIGVVPEGMGLFERLNAPEYLEFVGRMYGLDKATTRKRSDELLEFMQLADRRSE